MRRSVEGSDRDELRLRWEGLRSALPLLTTRRRRRVGCEMAGQSPLPGHRRAWPPPCRGRRPALLPTKRTPAAQTAWRLGINPGLQLLGSQPALFARPNRRRLRQYSNNNHVAHRIQKNSSLLP